MRDNPKPFEIYRHFKGNLYQILTLATDSETGSPMVVYQAMYGDFKVYVRPLAMFMSRVDKEKYPDITCEMRFEKVETTAPSEMAERPEVAERSEVTEQSEVATLPETTTRPEESAGEVPDLDPLVLAFLDACRVEERINILASIHHRITDDMINTMAVVLDVEINEGPVEERYQELKNCLLMKQKFEKVRF